MLMLARGEGLSVLEDLVRAVTVLHSLQSSLNKKISHLVLLCVRQLLEEATLTRQQRKQRMASE